MKHTHENLSNLVDNPYGYILLKYRRYVKQLWSDKMGGRLLQRQHITFLMYLCVYFNGNYLHFITKNTFTNKAN